MIQLYIFISILIIGLWLFLARPRLVTDGKEWAIRKGFFVPRFYDLVHNGYWWTHSCKYINDSWTYNKEIALQALRRLKA